MVGTNDFITVEPECVFFKGFETMKLNIRKFRVMNNSTKMQRIHILPPMSPYFRINYKKKGGLAPGISEEVAIHFYPHEYRNYYDKIRIHTEDENLVVPIHAFPVLDRENLRNVFPKLIDFGILDIGNI